MPQPLRHLKTSSTLGWLWGYRLLLLLIVAGPCCYLLGPAVVTARSHVNRDAGHYYLPLFQWTAQQWGNGEIPLWNPQENGGYPVAADATASLFYPVKMLYALPVNFFRIHAVYTLFHLLLAAGGVWLLARQWKISAAGAAFAAVAYSMAGAVSFQYCNIVFLVGAAWLPLALLTGDRMFRQQSLFWSLLTSAVLALMTLGGDPQAAYHGGLCLAGYACLVRADASPRSRSWLQKIIRSKPALLSIACGSLICLAAVQFFPSWQWTRQSHRAAYMFPRNIYEAAEEMQRGDERGMSPMERAQRGILGQPETGTHHDHAYQFSIAPWRAAELLWPNFYGRTFPVNHRWETAIPGADRLWTPSIYLGLLPLILGVGSLRIRRGKPWQRWMTCVFLLAGAASLGWYGGGWLLHEFRAGVLGADPDDLLVGQPVGGVYWLMATLLPGYMYFRYPAKIATLATLALAVLAGCGFDRVFRGGWKWPLRGVAIVGVLSGTGVVIAVAVRPFWNRVLEQTYDDSFFGPVSSSGSANDLLFALIHALVLCLIAGWIFRRHPRSHKSRLALLAITAVELCIAHGWTAPLAPDALWRKEPYVASVIDDHAATTSDGVGRIYRSRGAKWLPGAWRRNPSVSRQRDGLRWDRATLMPKHQLLTQHTVMTGTHTSLTPHDYIALMHAARYFGVERTDGVREPQPRVLDYFGASYRITPEDYTFPGDVRLSSDDSGPVNVAVSHSKTALPRAWIVHDVVTLPSLKNPTWQQVEDRTVQTWFPRGKLRSFENQAVVEAETAPGVKPAPTGQTSTCEIIRETPACIVLVADLQQPGLLVLSDRYDPGWKATVQTGAAAPQHVAVLRTNRVMRGVALPAGRHQIELRYQPAAFRLGALLSIAAWVVLAGACLWRLAPREPAAE